MKNKKVIIIAGALTITALIILVAGFIKTKKDYQHAQPDSEFGKYLTLFRANTSQHNDPAPGCWYDAGDYVVFIPHQIEATLYLTEARKNIQDPEKLTELDEVISTSVTCIDQALAENWKQFRDVRSHGVNLPPWLHKKIYPEEFYKFEEGEGLDAWLLWKEIVNNLENTDGLKTATKIDSEIASRTKQTYSSNCCESGPLKLKKEAYLPLTGQNSDEIWGYNEQSKYWLENSPSRITALLDHLASEEKPEINFHYWSGNRDIAGTVALERLYSKKTGDTRFLELSNDLLKLLEEDREEFEGSFIDDSKLYHPCRFFNACTTEGILASGLDFSKPKEPWRLHEPTLVTQATYILAKSLTEDW